MGSEMCIRDRIPITEIFEIDCFNITEGPFVDNVPVLADDRVIEE